MLSRTDRAKNSPDKSIKCKNGQFLEWGSKENAKTNCNIVRNCCCDIGFHFATHQTSTGVLFVIVNSYTISARVSVLSDVPPKINVQYLNNFNMDENHYNFIKRSHKATAKKP